MKYLQNVNQFKLVITLILGLFCNNIFAQQNVDIFTPNNQEKMYQNNVLIELFSSEGCSSCPIADAFMQEVIHLSDSTTSPVYVIDYHVDYWNKSGWVDPFSDSLYTKKQMNYALKKAEKNLYTPMAFVNGGNAHAGADKKGISVETILRVSLSVLKISSTQARSIPPLTRVPVHSMVSLSSASTSKLICTGIFPVGSIFVRCFLIR
jgi:hypothetical protein